MYSNYRISSRNFIQTPNYKVNNESIKRKTSFKYIKIENIWSHSVKSFCGVHHLTQSNIVSANSILNEIIKEKDQNAYLLNLIFLNLVKQPNRQKIILKDQNLYFKFHKKINLFVSVEEAFKPFSQ